MSANAVAWAWECSTVKQNWKLLLLFLAENADRFGRCSDPKRVMDDAAKVMGIGDSRVKAHFEDLQTLKLVTVEEGSYQLTVPQPKLGVFRFDRPLA